MELREPLPSIRKKEQAEIFCNEILAITFYDGDMDNLIVYYNNDATETEEEAEKWFDSYCDCEIVSIPFEIENKIEIWLKSEGI